MFFNTLLMDASQGASFFIAFYCPGPFLFRPRIGVDRAHLSRRRHGTIPFLDQRSPQQDSAGAVIRNQFLQAQYRAPDVPRFHRSLHLLKAFFQ